MSSLGLPKADRPKEVGFSAKRLGRLSATFRQDVERNMIPGAVVLIARDGQIAYAEAFGYRDREAKEPMELDAIFRIASMTKPLTSTAAMILAEEGKLQIAAPVAEYLPEFADRTVGADRVPAKQTMTVQDLLRHTSGLTYAAFGDSPVQMIWRDAQPMTEDQTTAEMVTKLASLPLMFEPGTTWEYSMSTDVFGRVVEVVSGQDLADFIEERICRPLDLRDTGFAATGERAERIAEPHIDPATAGHARRCATSPGRHGGRRAAAARCRRRRTMSGSARCC
jgi:CubicO group peptidase (beta-lactamase class C family)